MAISVRYVVDDASDLTLYELLGFEVLLHPGPGFAALARDGVRLYLNAPGAGGGGRTTTGVVPQPGGWNRVVVDVDSVADTLDRLVEAGVRVRSGVVDGQAGRQAVVEDASGNAVELFEPAR